MGILNQEQRQLRMGYSNQVFTAATQQEWSSQADRALFILPSGSQASSHPHSAHGKSPEKPDDFTGSSPHRGNFKRTHLWMPRLHLYSFLNLTA